MSTETTPDQASDTPAKEPGVYGSCGVKDCTGCTPLKNEKGELVNAEGERINEAGEVLADAEGAAAVEKAIASSDPVALNIRIQELEAQLAQRTAEREAMRETVTRLNGTNVSRQRELEELKEKVVRIALNYARENNWCDAVKRALREMGLEIPKTTISFEVTATWTVEAEIEDTNIDPDTIDEDWVAERVSVEYPSGSYRQFSSFDPSEQSVTIDSVSVE